MGLLMLAGVDERRVLPLASYAVLLLHFGCAMRECVLFLYLLVGNGRRSLCHGTLPPRIASLIIA
jgi:hypothetical protein